MRLEQLMAHSKIALSQEEFSKLLSISAGLGLGVISASSTFTMEILVRGEHDQGWDKHHLEDDRVEKDYWKPYGRTQAHPVEPAGMPSAASVGRKAQVLGRTGTVAVYDGNDPDFAYKIHFDDG